MTRDPLTVGGLLTPGAIVWPTRPPSEDPEVRALAAFDEALRRELESYSPPVVRPIVHVGELPPIIARIRK